MQPAYIVWFTTENSFCPPKVKIANTPLLLCAAFEKAKIQLSSNFDNLVRINWAQDFEAFWKHANAEVVHLYFTDLEQNKIEVLNEFVW